MEKTREEKRREEKRREEKRREEKRREEERRVKERKGIESYRIVQNSIEQERECEVEGDTQDEKEVQIRYDCEQFWG